MIKYADFIKLAETPSSGKPTVQLTAQPAADAGVIPRYANTRQIAPAKRGLPGWAGIGLLGYAAWKAINNNNNEPYQRAAVEAARRPIDLMTYDTSLLRQ